MSKEQELAQDLLETMRSLYGSQHRFEQVDATTFRKIDQKYYQRTQRLLEKLGFRKIADIEDVTVTQTNPANRTFIRVFLSSDRTIVGACYHFPLGGLVRLLQWVGLAPRGGKVIDLETELSDGSFVVTSNTLEMDRTIDIPGIHRQQFSHQTGAEMLLNQHRAKLRKLAEQGNQPISHNNYAEIEAAQHRLQAIKSGYRASVGFVTDQDIDRTASNRQQPTAEVLKNALQDARRNDFVD